MNLKLIIILLLSTMLTTFHAVAQKGKDNNKAEEKEWAKKLKALKPMDYKSMVEEQEMLKAKLASQSSELDAMRTEVDPLKSELKVKNQEIESLNARVTSLQSQLEEVNSSASSSQSNDLNAPAGKSRNASAPIKGLVYKVQIGAFKNKDLTKYFDNNPNFSGEVDNDGTKKYTLGAFEDYWEADTFKKYLREMGVSDAWIVAYKDGLRVNLKDAREGVL